VHIVPIKWISSLTLFMSMHVMYCALRIGFLYGDVIGCILVSRCFIGID
jgi:hypothetical protein